MIETKYQKSDGQILVMKTIKYYKCKKCNNIQTIHAQSPPVLLDLYCVKCLENILDEKLGKMEEII
jgi:hypothetical protein